MSKKNKCVITITELGDEVKTEVVNKGVDSRLVREALVGTLDKLDERIEQEGGLIGMLDELERLILDALPEDKREEFKKELAEIKG